MEISQAKFECSSSRKKAEEFKVEVQRKLGRIGLKEKVTNLISRLRRKAIPNFTVKTISMTQMKMRFLTELLILREEERGG